MHPLSINAHQKADEQLVPIVDRSRLHVVLIGFDHVLGVQTLQTRHLITCVTALLRHRFHGLLHLNDSNLSLSSWNISLRASKSDNRTVTSSSNSSSEITGRASVVDIVDALLNQHS